MSPGSPLALSTNANTGSLLRQESGEPRKSGPSPSQGREGAPRAAARAPSPLRLGPQSSPGLPRWRWALCPGDVPGGNRLVQGREKEVDLKTASGRLTPSHRAHRQRAERVMKSVLCLPLPALAQAQRHQATPGLTTHREPRRGSPTTGGPGCGDLPHPQLVSACSLGETPGQRSPTPRMVPHTGRHLPPHAGPPPGQRLPPRRKAGGPQATVRH